MRPPNALIAFKRKWSKLRVERKGVMAGRKWGLNGVPKDRDALTVTVADLPTHQHVKECNHLVGTSTHGVSESQAFKVDFF